ncbi:uncharacterized protein LOC107370221 [Tetranychus urticae]|uniref:uncharacterized protein LOC107370221 n=1 Tax=Tetranychus urticae TaxID=32264 RepID=UPI00077BF8C5|nr:uncharacterized protein LOC107370221 [Tetranychus urticae]
MSQESVFNVSIDYESIDQLVMDLALECEIDDEICMEVGDSYARQVLEAELDQQLNDDINFDECIEMQSCLGHSLEVREETMYDAQLPVEMEIDLTQPCLVTMPQTSDGIIQQVASEQPIRTSQVGFGTPSSNNENSHDQSSERIQDIQIDFEVTEEGPWRSNPTFHSKTKLLRAKLVYDENRMIDLIQVSSAIDTAYERFVEKLISDASSNDMIYITFRNTSENRELYVAFLKRNFNKETFLDRAYALAQSAGSFLDSNIFEIKVQIVECLSGGANRISRLQPGSLRSHLKKSVHEIINDDNQCGYIAIAIGKFLADLQIGDPNLPTNWKNLRRHERIQRKLAADLFMSLDMVCETAVDMNILADIQEKLENYQIIVIDQRTQLKIFGGPEQERQIFLEFTQANHYNVITKIAGYMDCNHFCTRCWVKGNKANHFCRDSCSKCSSASPCRTAAPVLCDICHIEFNSQACFDTHIQKSMCIRKMKCETCWIVYNAGQPHICDTYKCTLCNCDYTHSPHYCHIKVLDPEELRKDDQKPSFLICYDIESMQVPLSNSEFEHQPNLLISHTICNECADYNSFTKNSSSCDSCGELEHIFQGSECVKKFCDYLYNYIAPIAHKKKARVTIVAHNQRGYDGHFIIQDFYKRDFQAAPNLIMTGSKILFASIANLRFIDSLSLFMQPLSSLCKSFNITELKKGFFPHRFNTPENQKYVGPMPQIEFYDPTSMKPKQYTEFLQWYQQQAGVEFDFNKEIIEYCRSDVQILQTSMLKFTTLFKSVTGLNPITRGFTLASIAMETFRANMLKPESLGITPTIGYGDRKHSVVGTAWLDSQEKMIGKKILREHRIGNFYADGYIPETKQVFEFWGCYFHGCPLCYQDRTHIIRMGDQDISVSVLFDRVQTKRIYYAHRGMTLHEIWEHELDKCDPYIKSRISSYEIIKKVGPISIRESFFGGRTNNIKFHHKCTGNERIRYLDFTSLYPYVLKKYQYPMDHPELIQENFVEIDSYFGFIKCKVLPPRNMNIAILPMRIGKKLLFPLCRTCAIEMSHSVCNHTEDDRYLTNTWTSIELQEAVKNGYRIVKIYQILHYPKPDESDSQFASYIRMWLKIKQEASGWPSWCQTEDDKAKYVFDYKSAEDVDLDPSKIEKNPGKRSIAKLMLNSFWGKLAQNQNMPKTDVLRSYADLWGVLNNPEFETLGLFEANQDTIIVQHKFNEESIEKVNPGKTNIAVASFVTAYARLELFRLLQLIENHREGRVLYFDTDSVVFIERDGDPEIKCGDYLGELTDEIEPGWICTQFVTLGPKNYGYESTGPNGEVKATIKVKGIKLTAAALDIITIERLVSMISNYIEGQQDEVLIQQSNITSNKFTHVVRTRCFEKIYRAVSEKRRIDGNNTRPYGYKSEEFSLI